MSRTKLLEIGGLIAGAVLVVFGVVALVLGVNARGTVRDSLADEFITGSPDMTPAAIKEETANAGLPASVKLPTCDVAGVEIKTGTDARCFASYMRIHTLEATGGLTYAQMGRYKATSAKGDDGLGGTNDQAKAVKDEATGQPVANPRRDIWVTYTALSNALNVSYMAEQLALFSVVVGVALLLTGIGLLILAVSVLGPKASAATVKTSAMTPATG
jgi:hypothetical protein